MCGGGLFSGGGSRKNIAVYGGHYMKYKNMGGGGGVLSTQPDQPKKAPVQKCKKL